MIAQLAAIRSVATVDHQMPIALQLILEFTVTDMTVIEQLPFAFSGLEPVLVVRVLDFPVFHIMALSDVLK